MSSQTKPEEYSSTTLRPPLRPPVRKHSFPFMSTFHYITDPLSYTVSSVVRRLSEDDANTPVARALSANLNEPMVDPTTGVFHPPQPPQRRLSPFQPPPLTPLELRGYKASTRNDRRLLTRALAEEIRLLVPARLQLVDHWDLIYSMEQDGSTLSTLYSRCDKFRGRRAGFVLIVRDSSGGISGAYLSDPPKPQAHYFGSGECFLWRSQILPALPDLSDLPPLPSEDTTHAQRMTTVGILKSAHASSTSLSVPQTNGVNGHRSGTSTPERIRFKAFPYTGENDFSIFCQPEYLSVGAGDGHYGLWLDGNLSKGVSQTCLTYGNEPLSDEGIKFDILGVEVWFIGSSAATRSMLTG